MKKILLFISLLILLVIARNYIQAIYFYMWCNAHKGQLELIKPDGNKINCFTNDYAGELDRVKKWAEGAE